MVRIIHGEGNFNGHKNKEIYYQYWRPPESRAVIIMVHGLGEHSGRYAELARTMVAEDFSFFSFDLRGHGKTLGRRGHVASFDELIFDLKAYITMIRKKETTKKIFLMGHSLGGLVALAYATEFPKTIAGIAVSSPALKIRRELSGIERTMVNLSSTIIPSFRFSNDINPGWLSHEKRVVEAYTFDELVHDRISARLIKDMNEYAANVILNAPSFKVPCFIMQAGADRLVSPEGSAEFYNRVQIKDKRFKIYKDFYHELFNETRRDEVIADLVDWLDPRTLM